MKQILPLARKKSLIVKELPTETLVYDLETDKAHCLNETAARVWKNCDGRQTVAQLRESMEQETNSPVPEEAIWLALDQLGKFNLIDDVPEKRFLLAGMNRRELVRRVGFAALALPVIVSISAPNAQAQASLLAPGSCCGNPTQCASGACNQNPICGTTPSSKACA